MHLEYLNHFIHLFNTFKPGLPKFFLLWSQNKSTSNNEEVSMTWQLYGPRYAKTRLRAYADSVGPDPRRHSLVKAFTQNVNGQQMLGWYFVHVQYDLNLRILRIIEGYFSLNAAYVVHLSRTRISWRTTMVLTEILHTKW